jgi:hypothetical protein
MLGKTRLIAALFLTTALFLCASASSLPAYTYTYCDETDHSLKVTIRFYDEPDRTALIEPKGCHVVPAESLLKSWSVETLFHGIWKEVLELTCDLLPGDYTFSIHIDEIRGSEGAARQTWNALVNRAGPTAK